MSNEPTVGLNIRAESSSKSARLGILPRNARIQIGTRSADLKWGRIDEVLEGAIAPVVQGGVVDPAASKGWVFLGELDAEGGEPELLDGLVVPPKPIPIKAGDLVGHVGEYQQHHDAQATAKRGWRPLLHLEVFSSDNVQAFVEKSRAYACKLPKGAGTLFVIETGAKLVYPSEPDVSLSPEDRVSLTADSPKEGRWAKVTRVMRQIAERKSLGTYDNASKHYSKGATFAGWYVGTKDDQRTQSESEATRKGYTRREVRVPTGASLWVDRAVWRDGAQQAQLGQAVPAWNEFPLQVKNAKAPEVGATRVLSPADLDALQLSDRAVDPDGNKWFRLNVRSNEADPAHNMLTGGWVCEKDHKKVSWQSPWAWPGFDFVEEGNLLPVDMLSGLYHSLGIAKPGEGKDFQARADKVEQSALVRKLYELIDRNKNGTLDAQELRATVKQPLLAQSLSRVIARYESEWGGDMAKWNALDPLMLEGKLEWQAEKIRIDKLRWWPKVAAKVKGFPSSPLASHIHAIGLVTNFISDKPSLSLEEARVRAFLRMIRVGEGTEGAGGYERLFGGSSFIKEHGKTFIDHPRILITKTSKAGKTYKSTAAGAYQVMGYTWDDPGQVSLRARYGIKDFTPKSQDRYGVVLVKHKRSALEEVKQGRIKEAIVKCNTEWASLPGSPYGQPTVDWAKAVSEYNGYLEQEKQGKSDLAIGRGEIDDLL